VLDGAKTTAWLTESHQPFDVPFTLAAAGRYRLSARAGMSTLESVVGSWATLELSVDGAPLGTFEVKGHVAEMELYGATTELDAGDHVLTVRYAKEPDPPPNVGKLEAPLAFDYFEIAGPLPPEGAPPPRPPLLTCDPDAIGAEACAEEILGPLVARAFRRPVEAEEVDGLVAIVLERLDKGLSFEEGLRGALHAALLSPSFLFRVELDPPGANAPHPLSGHELATRLSYFLWASTPDDELRACADQGYDVFFGGGACALDAEVDRMLDDERSVALVDHFGRQWLGLDGLDAVAPDPSLFPDFDEELRSAMRQETSLFLRELFAAGGPLLDAVDAPFTFANARLAAHYGLPPPEGEGFSRVDLHGTPRVGFLTQGSVLSATSHGTRTSPTLRGKWILGRLLCAEPPPPPADVPALAGPGEKPDDLREMLEAHAKDPVCAGCHVEMDALGFALERFDAIGHFRDGVDARATLPGGAEIEGAPGLAAALRADPAAARCFASHLATYALGRLPGAGDALTLDEAAELVRSRSFRELVQHVVHSPAFVLRAPEGATP
jgi:hypothetical protein